MLLYYGIIHTNFESLQVSRLHSGRGTCGTSGAVLSYSQGAFCKQAMTIKEEIFFDDCQYSCVKSITGIVKEIMSVLRAW